MHPLDRRAELVRRGVTIASIARELEYTDGHVGLVLHGHRRHPRTEIAIAEKIGRPVSEVFPEAPANQTSAAVA